VKTAIWLTAFALIIVIALLVGATYLNQPHTVRITTPPSSPVGETQQSLQCTTTLPPSLPIQNNGYTTTYINITLEVDSWNWTHESVVWNGVSFTAVTWQQAGTHVVGNTTVLQTLPTLEFSVSFANQTVERNWTYMPTYPLDVLPNVSLANGAVLVSGLRTCTDQEYLVISVKDVSIHTFLVLEIKLLNF